MKKVRYFIFMIFIVSSNYSFSSTASIESTILPGEKLVVNFEFSQAPSSYVGEVDFFEFSYGGSFTDFFGSSYVDARLYDGNTLLGSKTITPSIICCTFVESGSPGTTFNTIDIDMSSIKDGSIDGRFEYVPFFDSPTQYSQIELAWSLSTGTFVSGGSFYPGTPDPTITNYEVAIVPVPTTIWLFGSGLIGLIGVARRKTRV